MLQLLLFCHITNTAIFNLIILFILNFPTFNVAAIFVLLADLMLSSVIQIGRPASATMSSRFCQYRIWV